MEDKRTDHEVIPSARRLITSLRDEGYDFLTAAADIIDNSIQANATEIDIRMEFDGDSSWFLVADNGKGMSTEELTEAMRFGTKREYAEGELGKFGLGLKTASISQCRKLTVASRNGDPGSEIEIRQLNLDHIEKTDRWVIQLIPKFDYSPLVSDPISDHSGTVILWENLDRMMNYDPPDGMRAKKGFLKMERDLEEHLSMVFHRFLSGELGPDRKVVIRMGGNPIKPWDPYARDEKGTLKFSEKTFAVSGAGRPFNVHCTAYVLPTKTQFSTPGEWSRAAGPKGWNFQQGFYIYREDRVIQSGGWSRMRIADEHTKYARIALDLHTDADFTLGLNIMKSSVVFPPRMKDLLEDTVENLCSSARKRYMPDKKFGGDSTSRTQSQHSNSPNSGAGNTQSHNFSGQGGSETGFTSKSSENPQSHTFTGSRKDKERQTLGESLERAAGKIGETSALNRIRGTLKSDDPEAASSLGW